MANELTKTHFDKSIETQTSTLTASIADLQENINGVEQELTNVAKIANRFVISSDRALGIETTEEEAAEYVKGMLEKVNQLTETAAKSESEEERKKAREERDKIKKQMAGLASACNAVVAPGFFGGLIPFYYAIKHLANPSSKVKWTGAALLIKDLALVGLGLLVYLSGSQGGVVAEDGDSTVTVMDDVSGEGMEFAEAA